MSLYIIILFFLLLIDVWIHTNGGKIKFLGNQYNKKEEHWIFISGIILALLSGVRYEDKHSDFLVNYRRMIQSASLSWQSALLSEEPANALLRKTLMMVFNTPQVYFIIAAFFIVFSYCFLIKKYSPFKYVALISFYCVGLFFTSNNLTRQSIAVAITWISWTYIVQQKPIKFFISIIVASAFHTSAIFFLPMYFLSKIKFKRNQLYIYLIAGILIFLARNPLLRIVQVFFYSNYTGDTYGTNPSNPLRLISVVFSSIYLVILVMNHDKAANIAKIENGDILINLISHGTIISYLLSILSATYMLILSRVALYWRTCGTIASLYAISTAGKNRKILMIVYITYNVGWFVVMDILGKHIPNPYTPFWQIPYKIG